MAEALVTKDTVWTACDALRARGERVSVNAIRSELGGGSPNAILPHLQSWRAQAETARPQAEADERPATDGAVSTLEALPEVGRALDALQGVVLEAVNRVREGERRQAEERERALQQAHATELEAIRRQHAADIEALRRQLDDVNADLADALSTVEQVEALNEELTRLRPLEGELRDARLHGHRMATERDRANADARVWQERLAKVEADLASAHEATAAAREAKGAAEARLAVLTEETARLRAAPAPAPRRASSGGPGGFSDELVEEARRLKGEGLSNRKVAERMTADGKQVSASWVQKVTGDAQAGEPVEPEPQAEAAAGPA